MSPTPNIDLANYSPNTDTSTQTVSSPPAATPTSTDDTTVKTDATTAVTDNTFSNKSPPPMLGANTKNSRNNTKNNADEMDDLSKSEAIRRARSHWNFVKSLHVSQKQSQRQLSFKMGESVSLTTAEATFLNMITKSRLDVDHDIVRGGDIDSIDSSPKVDELALSGRSHFSHLVQAAIAKERLRAAISARLSALSGVEANFLTKLVDNQDVTLEALENAVHVLDNDPLYNPALRRDESEYCSEFHILGGIDENEEEGHVREDEEVRLRAEEIKEKRTSKMKRQSSGIQSSMFFDKVLDDANNSGAAAITSNTASVGSRGEEAPNRRRPFQRSASVAESSIWNLATSGTDPDEQEIQDAASAPPSLDGRGLSESFRVRKASLDEQSMWKLVHGESIEIVDSDVARSLKNVEDEDGLPVKSINRGEAMDPLLMAVPMEQTPLVRRKTLEKKDGEKKVGLDQLLSYSQRTNKQPPMPGSPGSEGENASFVDETQEISSQLLMCCGVESMSLMNDILHENMDGVDGSNNAAAAAENNVEEDSLASKKRYLQLNKNNVENDRHTHLTTWMGAPEDYPILGLGKKQTDGEGESFDPLEPHVLSPLLMKCLRDHLPYALKEENFWLKYSLVRDGASLEAIFSTMRHSQHTILAIETSHGEVFGSFTSSPWRSSGNEYYGSCEAFVWNLRKTRLDADGKDSSHSLDEYILRESSLDVFQWNAKDGNRNVQLLNKNKLFVGGCDPDVDVAIQKNQGGKNKENDTNDRNKNNNEKSAKLQWGMALALDKDLLRGTSSRCATFASNPLIDRSRYEGSEVFEIMNMEIWALTPCMNEEMAEELELGRTFVMGHHSKKSS